jgi:hypothetical protein
VPAEFWRITLREYVAHMQGAGLRIKRELHDRMQLAHTIESLHRVKKIPRLAAMISEPTRAKAQAADDMLAIAMRWDKAINKG